MSLADALDQPLRAFLTGGDASWLPQTATTHDLVDAAKAGPISDGQFTWVQTHVVGPATATFWWKVSSEDGYDFLFCDLDTVPLLKISGQLDWQQETVTLGDGDHILRWTYRKDRNTSAGNDTGWLDQLQIAPTPAQPKISNVTLDTTGLTLTGTVQPLPSSGNVILETSSNLTSWIPVSTNQITGASLNFQRPTTNTSEYLRVKLQ